MQWIESQPVLTACVMFVVQAYYAKRLWVVSGRHLSESVENIDTEIAPRAHLTATRSSQMDADVLQYPIAFGPVSWKQVSETSCGL